MEQTKKAGTVSDIIGGSGGLIIIVIITLVVVSTLLGSNLLGNDLTRTISVANETGYCNDTGYTLTRVNSSNSAYTIVELLNATDDAAFAVGNCTVNAAGLVKNASSVSFNDAKFSYTFTNAYDNKYEDTATNMGGNLTGGIDNVSAKIPTILLIAAVVLLFGVLIILVQRAKQMTLGGDSSL